jgi:hypothetical protein
MLHALMKTVPMPLRLDEDLRKILREGRGAPLTNNTP